MVDLFGVVFPMAYVHVGTLLATAILILIADHDALSWVRGKKATLSLKKLQILHVLVGIGLFLMILSGAYMALPMLGYLVTELAFWTKMLFVLILVVNSFFIGHFMKKASVQPFAALSEGEKRTLLLSGGASALGWIGAFVAALSMTTSNWIASLLSQLF